MTWLISISLLACAASQDSLKSDDQELVVLEKAAEAYNRALRWGDADTAKAFLEGTELRLEFDEWLNTEGKENKISDMRVLRVSLDPASVDATNEASRPPPGHLREATVTVRKEGYAMDDLIVHQETIEQTWYRTETGWFVTWPDPVLEGMESTPASPAEGGPL